MEFQIRIWNFKFHILNFEFGWRFQASVPSCILSISFPNYWQLIYFKKAYYSSGL